jgi:protein-L-isoaspartate(D-aspartate) O-methyltransferase
VAPFVDPAAASLVRGATVLAVTEGSELRRALVRRLERAGAISSPAVRDAFLEVPRERFLPGRALGEVYRDEAILTRRDRSGAPMSSSSQPAIMALMLERLNVEPGQRVLEVGAGTGYNAALLATIAGPGCVVSVELDDETAAAAREALAAYEVEVVTGDGREGWAPGAPYDRMIVTASAETVPRAWHDQLTEGGILVAPLRAGGGHPQAIPALRKEEDGFRSVSVLCGSFMPLRGGPIAGRPDLIPPRGRARIRPFRSSGPRWALALYLALEAPEGSYVDGDGTFGIRIGQNLALVTDVGICAWGGSEAEELLERLLEEWRARGRPTESRLTITVRYDDERARIGHGWQD